MKGLDTVWQIPMSEIIRICRNDDRWHNELKALMKRRDKKKPDSAQAGQWPLTRRIRSSALRTRTRNGASKFLKFGRLGGQRSDKKDRTTTALGHHQIQPLRT